MDRRQLLKKIGTQASKKISTEAIDKGLQIDKNTQQIIKDMVNVGENIDSPLTRREFLGQLGQRLMGRQLPKIIKKYDETIKNSKFSYMNNIISF